MSTHAHLRRSIVLAGTAAVVVSAPAALAQTRGGLYDPEPPADSAYVRIVVLGGDPLDIYVDEKLRSAKVAGGDVSDYLVLAGGKRTISIHVADRKTASLTYVLDVPKGKALTLAFNSLKPGVEPTVFEDKANTNKLKAVVAAYNLDAKSGPLDVMTSDGSTKVFSNLAVGASNSIQVNPISVDLIGAKAGSGATQNPIKVASLSMSQGATYSVFFMTDAKGNSSAKSFQNKTERYSGK